MLSGVKKGFHQSWYAILDAGTKKEVEGLFKTMSGETGLEEVSELLPEGRPTRDTCLSTIPNGGQKVQVEQFSEGQGISVSLCIFCDGESDYALFTCRNAISSFLWDECGKFPQASQFYKCSRVLQPTM